MCRNNGNGTPASTHPAASCSASARMSNLAAGPERHWFDRGAVDEAERRLRDKHAVRQREIDKDRREDAQRYEQARLARDQMARKLGYPDFSVMQSMGAPNRRQPAQQSAPRAAPPTEADRDELRRARIALGIDTQSVAVRPQAGHEPDGLEQPQQAAEAAE